MRDTADLAILVATRNRGALLRQMLASLETALATAPGKVEVLLADSASTDTTPAVIEDWVKRGPRRRAIRLDRPGKSRALNAALSTTGATLVAFTDDDVEVAPDWIERIADFFATYPDYAAATGRVRTPPRVTDPKVLRRVRLFGTLPLFDLGDRVVASTHLYGCNMAIRASALESVGAFHEGLGPGASGLHEDGDMARRLLERGLRVGYMPEAIVYHAVEEERLAYSFFRDMHRRDARSRFVLGPNGHPSDVALRWLGAALVATGAALIGRRVRMMKAVGRMISHAEMLRLLRRQHRENRG